MDINVRVKTGKKENRVIKNDFADYEVWVKSPPIRGLANKELIKVLAAHFNVKEYDLRIIKGLTSPFKILRLIK